MQIRFLRKVEALVTSEPGAYESWEKQSFRRGEVVDVLQVRVHEPPRNDMSRVEFPDRTVAMLVTEDFEVLNSGT
jgi:hypothetical protein